MSDRIAYDALPYGLPRTIRSKLLEYEPIVAAQQDGYGTPELSVRPEDDEVSIPVFKYTSLPPHKKRIRLLRLYPGVLANPQVDCELFEAEFVPEPVARPDGRFKLVRLPTVGADPYGNIDQNHVVPEEMEARLGPDRVPMFHKQDPIEYEALSWRWGDERHGKFAIMIHEKGVLYKKRVSETLGLALKCLRYERDRYLWVDALCINQDDNDERSSQVAIMSLVYTGAKQVCVWLGEDDEESALAFKFIREDIRGLKNFDRLCTDKLHAPKWRALLVLMQRAWFSRRWVVQEIVLARGATVYCGPDKIPWRDLAIAVELFVEVETATHRLSELMKKDEKFDLIPNWFEHISELGASILVNATAKVFRESKHADNLKLARASTKDANELASHQPMGREIMSQRSLLSLEYLVTSLTIFDCGRPHDSVYALVAVARDARPRAPSTFNERTGDELVLEICSRFLQEKPYVLDYSRPYADVCKDFVEFCILRCANQDMVQALNILCRPWAKDWRPGDRPSHPPSSSQHTFGTENSRSRRHTSHKEWIIKDSDTGEERLDNRTWDEYWAEAESRMPVRDFIKRWFPKGILRRETDLSRAMGHPITSRHQEGIRARGKNSLKQQIKDPVLDPPDEHELFLPSWVLRTTAAPFDIFPHPGIDMVKMGRKNADPLAGVPQDGYRNYSAGQTKKVDLDTLRFQRRPRCNHYSLYVKGFWFDTVQEVAQVSQGGAIPGTWLDLAGWEDARRPPTPDADIGDPPDEFWRTLVADRGRHDRNPPYYYARACKETIIKGGLRSGAVDTTALMYNERNSIVAEFCRRVQAVIWNRALFKTKKGHLGLGSEKVKVGDKVCIVYGCTVPIILRMGKRKTREEYTLEKYEDGVEKLKTMIRQCAKIRARKEEWSRECFRMSIKAPEDLSELRRITRDYNEEAKTKPQEDQKKKPKINQNLDPPSDNESEDNTDQEMNGVQDEHEDDDDADIASVQRTSSVTDEVGRIGNQGSNDPASGLGWQTVVVNDQQSAATDTIVDSMPGSDIEYQPTQQDAAEPISSAEEQTSDNGRVDPRRDIAGESESQVPDEARTDDQQSVPRTSQQHASGAKPHLPDTRPKTLRRASTNVRKKDRQTKADARDTFRHYEFLGEAYVHGMMDGAAVRQNFYNEKPDHIFEIR